MRGTVDGHAVLVGRPALLAAEGIEDVEAQGAPEPGAVQVAWDGRARGVLTVADAVKETSAEAVARLRISA